MRVCPSAFQPSQPILGHSSSSAAFSVHFAPLSRFATAGVQHFLHFLAAALLGLYSFTTKN